MNTSERNQKIAGLISHLIRYATVMLILLVINLITEPSYLWVVWPAMGWGIALLIQTMDLFSPEKKIMRMLNIEQ